MFKPNQLKIIGYCEHHGIKVHRTFLSENWLVPVRRYAIIETAPGPARFSKLTYDTLEAAEKDWTRKKIGHERGVRHKVIDIEDGLEYSVDEGGAIVDPKPLGDYPVADPKELKARRSAATKSNLITSLTAAFGEGYLNARRRRIIDSVSNIEISVETSGPLESARIRVAYCPEGDLAAELLGELFDPAEGRPLRYVEAYPWCTKYRLADEVIAYHRASPLKQAWLRTLGTLRAVRRNVAAARSAFSKSWFGRNWLTLLYLVFISVRLYVGGRPSGFEFALGCVIILGAVWNRQMEKYRAEREKKKYDSKMN